MKKVKISDIPQDVNCSENDFYDVSISQGTPKSPTFGDLFKMIAKMAKDKGMYVKIENEKILFIKNNN